MNKTVWSSVFEICIISMSNLVCIILTWIRKTADSSSVTWDRGAMRDLSWAEQHLQGMDVVDGDSTTWQAASLASPRDTHLLGSICAQQKTWAGETCPLTRCGQIWHLWSCHWAPESIMPGWEHVDLERVSSDNSQLGVDPAHHGVLDDQVVDCGEELVSLSCPHQSLQRQCDQICQVLCGAV